MIDKERRLREYHLRAQLQEKLKHVKPYELRRFLLSSDKMLKCLAYAERMRRIMGYRAR